MWEHIYPLAILALIIIAFIFATTYLIWRFSTEFVDASREKRSTKGRRRSDQ